MSYPVAASRGHIQQSVGVPAPTVYQIVLQAAGDAYVQDDVANLDTNYGSAVLMQIGESIIANNYRSFITFDVSAIPATATAQPWR